MHQALELRVRWILNEYLRKRFADVPRPVLLDMGRYEVTGSRRANLLLESRFSVHTLPGPEAGATEWVPEERTDWEEIADGYFDVVLAAHVLEHYLRPWAAFKEIARSLKPGGVVCVVEPGLSERPAVAGEENRETPVSIPSYLRHPRLPDHHRFDAAGLAALAESYGLKIAHASMNMAPENPPDGWFAYSEVVLIAEKPVVPEVPDPVVAPSLLPVSLPRYLRERNHAPMIAGNRYFSAFRDRGKKLSVVGPCHARALAIYLRRALHGFSVKYFPTDAVVEQSGGMVFQPRNRDYENSDVVVAIDSPGLEDVCCPGGTVIRFPVVTFCGFHPDFLAPTIRWQGVRGSCIAAECFLRGWSEEKTLSMFTHDTYSRLGYYLAWDEACERLDGVLALQGLDLGHFLPGWMRRGVFMCEAFHPRDFVLKDIIDFQLDRAGIAVDTSVEADHYTHELTGRVPVYPEIARYLHMPEAGSYLFRRTNPAFPPWHWEDCINLDEYINLSFEGYRQDAGILLQAFGRVPEL